MSPKEFAAIWAKENPDFTGLLLVNREEPAGKGGRKRKIVTRRFLAMSGQTVKQKTDSSSTHCHFRHNGECACCHRMFFGLELTAKRSFFVDASTAKRGLIHVGLFCADCRKTFDYPKAGPKREIIIEMEPYA